MQGLVPAVGPRRSNRAASLAATARGMPDAPTAAQSSMTDAEARAQDAQNDGRKRGRDSDDDDDKCSDSSDDDSSDKDASGGNGDDVSSDKDASGGGGAGAGAKPKAAKRPRARGVDADASAEEGDSEEDDDDDGASIVVTGDILKHPVVIEAFGRRRVVAKQLESLHGQHLAFVFSREKLDAPWEVAAVPVYDGLELSAVKEYIAANEFAAVDAWVAHPRAMERLLVDRHDVAAVLHDIEMLRDIGSDELPPSILVRVDPKTGEMDNLVLTQKWRPDNAGGRVVSWIACCTLRRIDTKKNKRRVRWMCLDDGCFNAVLAGWCQRVSMSRTTNHLPRMGLFGTLSAGGASKVIIAALAHEARMLSRVERGARESVILDQPPRVVKSRECAVALFEEVAGACGDPRLKKRLIARKELFLELLAKGTVDVALINRASPLEELPSKEERDEIDLGSGFALDLRNPAGLRADVPLIVLLNHDSTGKLGIEERIPFLPEGYDVVEGSRQTLQLRELLLFTVHREFDGSCFIRTRGHGRVHVHTGVSGDPKDGAWMSDEPPSPWPQGICIAALSPWLFAVGISPAKPQRDELDVIISLDGSIESVPEANARNGEASRRVAGDIVRAELVNEVGETWLLNTERKLQLSVETKRPNLPFVKLNKAQVEELGFGSYFEGKAASTRQLKVNVRSDATFHVGEEVPLAAHSLGASDKEGWVGAQLRLIFVRAAEEGAGAAGGMPARKAKASR